MIATTPGAADDAGMRRGAISAALALLVVWILFAVLLKLAGGGHGKPGAQRVIDRVDVVDMHPPAPPPDLTAPPPPPPPPPPAAAPPAAHLDAAPAAPAAAPAISTLDVGNIAVPLGRGALDASGLSLTGSGSFAGFAGSGSGSGAGTGGGGFGTGKGFKGKELIPVATARPQIPEWAYKAGIEGWVEVVFTVLPNGHVTNIRIVDAKPRGAFEAIAIESISHWNYEPTDKAHEVLQRVEFKLADYKYNWK
jgi:TonB family protein